MPAKTPPVGVTTSEFTSNTVWPPGGDMLARSRVIMPVPPKVVSGAPAEV